MLRSLVEEWTAAAVVLRVGMVSCYLFVLASKNDFFVALKNPRIKKPEAIPYLLKVYYTAFHPSYTGYETLLSSLSASLLSGHSHSKKKNQKNKNHDVVEEDLIAANHTISTYTEVKINDIKS